MTQTDQELDRIERSIDIDATAEQVWSLDRSGPGWWINEQEVDPDPEIRREAASTTWSCTRSTASSGSRPSSAIEPRHISYHWVDNVAPEAGTTVEFWIEDRAGGVTLRVVESGFSGLKKDRAASTTRSRRTPRAGRSSWRPPGGSSPATPRA